MRLRWLLNMGTDPFDLVEECVDANHPRIIIRQLAQQVEKLMREHVSNGLIREALKEWDTRPDAGPPMLPHLISTVIRRRRAQQRQDERRASLTDWEDRLNREMNE